METVAVLRERMVEIGRRMYQKDLVAGTDGNISCRLPEGRLLITPSGKPKGRLSPRDLVIVDESGDLVSGEGRPSSEYKLHAFIYAARDDVEAIVHAHPVFTTAFASVGKPLDESILPEVVISLGGVPLADYGTPSTSELPDSIRDLIGNHDAILLRNHGVVVMGRHLEDTYNKLELVEHFAKVLFASNTLGGAKPLSETQIARLMEVGESLRADGRGDG